MNRPLHIWLLFGVCLGVLLAALGWVSVTTLRLDRAQLEADQQAELEEGVRLALWRMDSLLTSIIVEESARPVTAWESFSGREPVFSKTYAQIPEARTPSPLLVYSSSNVILHFQLSADGRLTSPQVPLIAEQRKVAEANYASPAQINSAAARLGDLQVLLNEQCFPPAPSTASAFSFPATKTAPVAVLNRDMLINQCAPFRTNTVGPVTVPALAVTSVEVPSWVASRGQQTRNSAEWAARTSVVQAAQQQIFANVNNQAPSQQAAAPVPVAAPREEGLFKPLWIQNELLLARRVNLEGSFVVQGAWLNWKNLKDSLAASVRDLFPDAELQPMVTDNAGPHARRLAAIPAQLVTGRASLPPLPWWSPSRRVLTVAWLGVLLAALAVAVLLHGTVSLSERRAVFVSAVTHELRTPLTTFKMYSEMLAEGMVADEKKRKAYLSTLCSEANRLSHLVENVLAFARLERGSARGRVERVSLGQLIERIKSRLDQRAAQADLKVVVDSDETALGTVVHVDPSAVEQILFNLVDNACKYAAPTATERVIHLEALPEGKFAMLRVRDHGQGISAEGARRLFQPFSKSAHEAALTAPGVGLGLALCRRLSRSMGGDLRLDALVKNGACFVLTLPLSSGGAHRAPASLG
ncbi:MAG: hypothetical protein QOF48_1463 [Verrucomicrobiota bacterium]|jgi:signal transduction histidine kinase